MFLSGQQQMAEIGPDRRENYDVAVAYRICPKVSRPAQNLPFGNDKLLQAEICLRSFRNSLGSLRIKLWVILDGCPREYRAIFERYFAPKDLVLIETDGIGNRATYGKQLDILLSQTDSEFVYFAEDDYLYLPDSFSLLLGLLRDRKAVDFVTPYDHTDCYSLQLHHEPKWVTIFGEHHWRTAASTCLTFLTRQSTLRRYETVFRKYCRWNDDCSIWLSITKRRVFSPFAMVQYFARNEFYKKVLPKAWLGCWRQILFGRAATLFVPIPSIATHLSAGQLSPGIDWLTLMRQEGFSPERRWTRNIVAREADIPWSTR